MRQVLVALINAQVTIVCFWKEPQPTKSDYE